ncbi:hypothetical protein KC865_02740 [Candidatus Kaiserbacteria bacterium]|nr:hypothetical protein [Candidatus Kaiserbacteria bacterium]USN92455.1 MAG: hypothetical protein H6782_01415 [Candidatus Nomurabacteria bacterium]
MNSITTVTSKTFGDKIIDDTEKESVSFGAGSVPASKQLTVLAVQQALRGNERQHPWLTHTLL